LGEERVSLLDRLLFLLTTHAIDLITRVHLALLRWSGGRLGWRTFGVAVLLLTTTGRKSGRPRTIPLYYFRDGDALVVIASNVGQPDHPGWYYNLQADPHATVQIRRARRPVVAEIAGPAEKRRLWPRVRRMSGLYEGYRRRTTRDIPVVRLRPARR
jgi:deazaflavin-dependent oxidoreductase (nitroreductase family)